MIKPGAVADNAPADTYSPSWWDFLFGGKPAASKALNPVKAAVGVFTPEVDAVENAIQPLAPEPERGPSSSYDQAQNYGGNIQAIDATLQQQQIFVIDCSVVGPVEGFNPADVDGNSLVILPRGGFDDGSEVESATDARLLVKYNNPSNLWLPFSLSVDPAGNVKNDLGSINTHIRRLWLQVVKAAENPNNKYMVIGLFKDVALGQPGAGAGSFAAPSFSPSMGASESVSGAGGAVAPPPSGGGTSGGGGGGTPPPTGGGGGGGGGTGRLQ